jgi:hypothetical protein
MSNQLDAALVAARKKNLEQVEQQSSVEVQSNSVTPTESPSKPEAQVETKEQPKEEPTKATKEEKVEVVESYLDADEANPTESIQSQDIDYVSLGSALELGETKTKDEFVSKASELKSKLKALEENPLLGIPDDFKEVIEVAKRSGEDWRDYLSQQIVDYTKVDPVKLFEDTFLNNAVKNPKYYTDGKYDHEKALTALETFQEPVKEFEGMKIAEAKTNIQRQRQLELKAKAEAKAAQAEKSLAQATKSLGELLPFDNYGIKFEPKHSSEIYQGITSSKLTKKHLGGMSYDDLIRSGADMKAIVRTITLAEKGEKMIAYKSNSSKVEAKKELLEVTQNVQLNTPGSKLNPEEPEKRELTPAEKLKQYYSATKVGL